MAVRPLLSMITDVTENLTGYPTPSHSPTANQVTCWLVDTRKLWPGEKITTAPGAQQALSLISPEERQTIITKFFVQDARMSLASALVKRLYICKTLGIRWQDVRMGRKLNKKNGKPCAVDESDEPIEGVDFNVSHQGGLVALVGFDGRASHDSTPAGMVMGMISPTTRNRRLAVGVDIVCVNERDDYRTIDAEGMDGYVDVYDFVFSAEERWSMKYDVDYITMLDGTYLKRDEIGRNDRCISRHRNISLMTPGGRSLNFSSERIIEAKLRRFYAYFCYKEAYIKVSGEALLAPWLRSLEFFNVRSPKPGVPLRCSTHGAWGETVEDVEVNLHKRSVKDVKMKIQALEENFMIATAIQGELSGVTVPEFTTLDLIGEVKACSSQQPPQLRSRANTGSNGTTASSNGSSHQQNGGHSNTTNGNSNGNSSKDASSPSSKIDISSLHIDLGSKPSSEQQQQHEQKQNQATTPGPATSAWKAQLGLQSNTPGTPGTPSENPYAHMNDVPLCLM